MKSVLNPTRKKLRFMRAVSIGLYFVSLAVVVFAHARVDVDMNRAHHPILAASYVRWVWVLWICTSIAQGMIEVISKKVVMYGCQQRKKKKRSFNLLPTFDSRHTFSNLSPLDSVCVCVCVCTFHVYTNIALRRRRRLKIRFLERKHFKNQIDLSLFYIILRKKINIEKKNLKCVDIPPKAEIHLAFSNFPSTP